MPRIARCAPGGIVYHVLNRGNDRKPIFHKRGDGDAFLRLLRESKDRMPGVKVLAFCLMSNHWHLSLLPERDGLLSEFMGWLSNAHVRRYREHYHTGGDGHLYQGRFKSFPVECDFHLLTMHRYVEANALRAGLATRAEEWRWGSLWHHLHGNPRGLLDEWPVDRPENWAELVNEPLAEEKLTVLRTSVVRGRPYGRIDWVERMAKLLGIEHTLRRRGRPKRSEPKPEEASKAD